MERGLAWHPDVTRAPEFLTLARPSETPLDAQLAAVALEALRDRNRSMN